MARRHFARLRRRRLALRLAPLAAAAAAAALVVAVWQPLSRGRAAAPPESADSPALAQGEQSRAEPADGALPGPPSRGPAVVTNASGPRRGPAPPTAPAPLPASVDIDGNGRVDILDAFALARRIRSGAALREEWDFNGDGRVDRGDADVVALAAVRLDRGT